MGCILAQGAWLYQVRDATPVSYPSPSAFFLQEVNYFHRYLIYVFVNFTTIFSIPNVEYYLRVIHPRPIGEEKYLNSSRVDGHGV